MTEEEVLEFLRGRIHGPEEDRQGDVRNEFQRDRGRIVHSAAFRRLQAKTQVMGIGEGDFHRTRLTHSIECALIGVGLLDQLRERTSDEIKHWLPEPALLEAACYAHDIGHPPFGHGGERALHQKMAAHGGFEGNAQTLRIIARLEKYRAPRLGINPTRRLVLAVLKYPTPYSRFADGEHLPKEETPQDAERRQRGCGPSALKPPKCFYDEDKDVVVPILEAFTATDRNRLDELTNGKASHRTLDSSLMELADDIAYGVHDIEDIVGRRLVTQEDVSRALTRAFDGVGGSLLGNGGELNAKDVCSELFKGSFERKQMISKLVSTFVTAVEVEALSGFDHPLLRYRATLPPMHAKLLKQLRAMAFDLVINKPQVAQLEFRGQHIVGRLFDALLADPCSLIQPTSWDTGVVTASTERRVCDFVAGMTDSYAEKVYRRLFVPGFGSSSDEL